MQKYIIYFIIRRVIKFFKNYLYPNTQQPLKAPAKSSLFSPNSCITQIKVVPLHRQSSPSLLTMLKSCEAFYIYTHLNMANLIPFTKRFESSENLVNLLESRGLQIYDRNKAIQYLDNIGYYRLSAYMYPLLKMPKTAHLYKEGSSFKKVMMLYRFDKKLRLLMFNEIEKIEIAIPK